MQSVESTVREIRRKRRKMYPPSTDQKLRIALEGLPAEDSIAELCRRERIYQNMYYKWSKLFLKTRF